MAGQNYRRKTLLQRKRRFAKHLKERREAIEALIKLYEPKDSQGK